MKKLIAWRKKNLSTVADWGAALTALVPMALTVGRAPADILVSIIAVLFLANCTARHNWDWVRKPWAMAALLLWAYSALRASFVNDGGSAFWAAFVWIRYIFFAASMAQWALGQERTKLWLLYTTAGSVLFLALDGLLQFFSGRDIYGNELLHQHLLTGPWPGRHILGVTIAFLFAPVIFWPLIKGHVWKSVILANICFATIYYSGDRMGLILAIAVMMTWFYFLMRTSRQKWTLFLVNLCFVVVLVLSSQRVFERQFSFTASQAKDVGGSAYGLVWKSAWDVGKAYPLFGVGMRQFREICPQERFGPLKHSATENLRCYTHPHNTYLEWFAEGGSVGLLGFVAFVLIVGAGLALRLASKKSDLILWGLAATLGIRLCPLFIPTSFVHNWSAIPFWITLGWAMSYTPIKFDMARLLETTKSKTKKLRLHKIGRRK